MSIHPPLCFVAWLLFTPLLSVAQQVAPAPVTPTVSHFAGKTFRLGEGSQTDQANPYYFIFQPEGRALYRSTHGPRVLKDSPLQWGVVGDSLYLLPSSWVIVAEGQTQLLARDTLKHAVEKVAGGYQLRRRKELMRLTEVK